MQDLHVVELGGESLGEFSGPVRRVVVDHENAHALFPERAQHRLEILELVVGGEANDGPRHPAYIQLMTGALPRNVDVADQLELLADLLELEGEASFRVLAYRRAATRIRETAGSGAELALAGRAKELSGIGKKTEERILKALAEKKEEPSNRRLLGDGLGPLLAVVGVLQEHPAAVKVSEAGSARRRKETFRDLDIIATATDPEALIDYFTSLKWVIEVVARGSTKATVLSNEGLRFDLRVVPPESYGNLLQHFTGSKDHNVALRERAVKKGLSVSEYSITVVETGEELTFADEAEVYARLGYEFIPPELRENMGELDAARRGELPSLVELKDVKGGLHCPTTWSDGRDTLEKMVLAARARGYKFLAVTDHPRGT